MLSTKDLDRFAQAYRRKLDEAGLERIQVQLDDLAVKYERPLVLACFETDPHYRHRGPLFSFDGWYEAQTGVEVPEWEPNGELAKTSQSEISGQLRAVWDLVANLGEAQRAQEALRSSAAAAARPA
jgi:hypothetical protein